MARRRPGPWRVLADHQWAILGLCAATAGLLGFFGIRDYYAAEPPSWPNGIEPTRLDVLYLTIQLFLWESGSAFIGPRVGGGLQLARLLAPAVTLWAAALTLIRLFVDERQTLRARLSSRHAIICGLGRRGRLYMKRLRDDGWTVVAIERDPANPGIVQARKWGAVLVGDARDPRELSRAGVSRATHLITVCCEDAVNVEVALTAKDLLLRKERKQGLTCHIHVHDRRVWQAIREREVGAQEGVRLHFVNPHESAARTLLTDYLRPRDGGATGLQEPLFIVGFSPLAEDLVLQVARDADLNASAQRRRITVVDRSASTTLAALQVRYPALNHAADLSSHDVEIGSAEYERGLFLEEGLGKGSPTAIVCLPDEAAAVTTGLDLFHKLRPMSGRVIVCVAEDAGLFAFLHGGGAGALGDPAFMLFRVLHETCRPSLLFDATNELLARAIHDEYRRHEARKGQTAASNLSMVPWEQLEERLKESNRRQADDLGRKLAAVSCGIAPLSDWTLPAFKLTSEEIEQLARVEHARWVKERLAAGWRYAPGPKTATTHPSLVEWESLPNEVKEIDRQGVREIPKLVAGAGFQIYRRQDGRPLADVAGLAASAKSGSPEGA